MCRVDAASKSWIARKARLNGMTRYIHCGKKLDYSDWVQFRVVSEIRLDTEAFLFREPYF